MAAEVAAEEGPLDGSRYGPSRRASWLWLAGITLLGAALRLVWLDRIPGGLYFDVAANLFDVLDVLDGAHPIWFPRNNGREPLMLYLQAATSLIWGPTPLAAEVAAALLGIPTVPAMYLLGRECAAWLGDHRARWVGLVAAFLTATMYWHVHFSRLGLRTIGLPLFIALGAALTLRALRTGAPLATIGGGAALGLAMYTYTASRLLPLAVLPVLVAAVASDRSRRSLAPAASVLALWIVVAGPLGFYYVTHRGDMDSHAAAVSVLNPEVGGGDPIAAGLHGLVATAGAIGVRGASSALENLPDRPLLEPLSGAAFAVGLGVALARLVIGPRVARLSALLLLLTLGAMALSPALSVNPPGFVRISGMVPPVLVLAALGYDRAREWLPVPARRWAPAALLVPLIWTTYDYFVVWAPSDQAFRGVMEDKAEGAALVRGWAERGERVFLAPLYAQDFTYRYLLRDVPFESFDLGAGLVEPGDGRPARYAFPPEDHGGLALVAERLRGQPDFEVAADATGQRPLLATLRVAPRPSSDRVRASFEDGIDLESVDLRPSTIHPGDTLSLELRWRAQAHPGRDYSVFVHGRDASGQTRFQRDRMPANGSVPTSRWIPGDLVGDFYEVDLPRDLAPGEYTIVIGLYRLDGGQRLRVTSRPDGPNELEVGRVRVGP